MGGNKAMKDNISLPDLLLEFQDWAPSAKGGKN
jgi:hypothetical protein